MLLLMGLAPAGGELGSGLMASLMGSSLTGSVPAGGELGSGVDNELELRGNFSS